MKNPSFKLFGHALRVLVLCLLGTMLVGNVFGSSTNAVIAWGDNSNGQTNVPPDLMNVVAIAAGYAHCLALKNDGTVVAWGAGTNNSGGSDNYGQSMVPSGLTNVVAIAGGSFHSLALKGDGTVVAWGDNSVSQTNVPPSVTNAVAIAAGWWHSLALKADGTVVAWGLNGWGQTNVPRGLTNVVAIAGGGYHCLALKADGTVVAWGAGTNNEGAFPQNGQSIVPSGLTKVVAIAAGGDYSLALKGDGTVVAWGSYSGWVPSGLTNVVAIATGDYHNLALVSDGTVVAWGSYIGSIPSGLTNVVAIAAGGYHSLALVNNGSLFITVQPFSQTVQQGAYAVFTVKAVGLAPLSYQWMLNGTNIAGATDSNYTLTNAQPATAGGYSAVITNTLGSVTSSVATMTLILDTNKPSVAIKSPANKAEFTSNNITVIGSATDKVNLKRVLVKLNNGSFDDANVTNSKPTAATWGLPLTLFPGTNTVMVKSVDLAGNESLPVSRSFFFRVPFTLTVNTNGNGMVLPNLNGSSLFVGRTYMMTAVPGMNWLFTNWTASVDGGPTNVAWSAAKYTFPMQSNLTLIANFVTNSFIDAAGNYYGLFWDTNNGVKHQSAGFASVTVKSSKGKPGTFSGSLSLEGQKHSFSGAFDVAGDGSTVVNRSSVGKSSLSLSLYLPMDGRDTISGVITNANDDWGAQLSGNRAVFSVLANPATNYAGSYTLVLPAPTNGIPGGDGYATVTVAGNGKITVTGQLGDAQTLNPSATVISKNGDWAFYAPAYLWTNDIGKKEYMGEILGWLSISNDAAKHIVGDLTWIKTGWTNGYYDAGFATNVTVLGGSYTKDTNRLVAITNGVVILNGGNLGTAYTNSFRLNSGNKFVVTNWPYGQLPGPLKTTKITPTVATGLIKVQFKNPANTNITTTATGVVLQDEAVVRGVFKGLTNETGSLLLQGQ